MARNANEDEKASLRECTKSLGALHAWTIEQQGKTVPHRRDSYRDQAETIFRAVCQKLPARLEILGANIRDTMREEIHFRVNREIARPVKTTKAAIAAMR